MKINFFLNSLSIHQAPLIKELSKTYSVKIFYDQKISPERQKLGWTTPDLGNCEILPLLSISDSYLKSMDRNTVNIFSGLNAYKKIHKIFLKAIQCSEAKNIVQMESTSFHGFKGFFKKFKYYSLALRYNKNIYCILSQGGKDQLIDLGFKNVHEFGYFLNESEDETLIENETLKFVFVGQISKRKQILELCEAISDRSDINFHLDIYGTPHDIDMTRFKASIKNSSIQYKGALDNKELRTILSNYDYLILPSKTEGWGAVVSEALLSGVGVCVSNVAGVVNYLKDRVNHNVNICDFSDMKSSVSNLGGLPTLKKEDRLLIKKQAYFLSSKYGADLFQRIVS